ncbi:AMP-binding enzyme [Nonomuraea maritima]|uniref:AMP-binding enzyme n=1 Tax=Nonomuraea maritima TaxID=683260 RepID=UPI0024802651|nr:hypothetical protein [Nonomuraea maritima]
MCRTSGSGSGWRRTWWRSATLSADELKRAVKEELAGYKTPRDVVFVPALPRNQTGKVDRARLLES